MLTVSVPFALLLAAFVGLLLLAAFGFGRFLRARELAGERRDAIGRSKSVILGEVYEKVLPFLPGFPYKPRDMVFLGKGIDYVVFDGMNEGELRRVVFLELKSGGSRLSGNEKMIREAVRAGRVEFEERRVEGF